MRGSLLIFPLYFITVYSSGEFSVLHSPPSVEFKGNEQLNTENIKDVFMAAFGYSVEDTAHWSGLYMQSPFNVAQSAFAVYIEGVEHLNLKGKVKSYPITGNSAQNSLDSLPSNLEGCNSLAVDLDLTQGTEALLTYADILGNINVPSNLKYEGSLKPSLHSADKLFLQQIAILNGISDNFATIEKKPTLITLRLSLNSIASTHGEGSQAMIEALKLLSEAIEKLDAAAQEAFNGDVLFVVVTDKSGYVRSKRQTEKEKELKAEDLNLATYYSEDYPIIFNIILWFGVVFAFSLLAICYAIGTMDPGRDSIIYRMTSTRMKKDN